MFSISFATMCFTQDGNGKKRFCCRRDTYQTTCEKLYFESLPPTARVGSYPKPSFPGPTCVWRQQFFLWFTENLGFKSSSQIRKTAHGKLNGKNHDDIIFSSEEHNIRTSTESPILKK